MVSCSNDHMNNLLQSSTKSTEGWDIKVGSGKWSKSAGVDKKCGPQWYGWSGGSNVGTISTMVSSSYSKKCGKLDFVTTTDASRQGRGVEFNSTSISIFELFGILNLLGFDYLDNRYNTMLYFISYNSCLNSLTIYK